MAMVIMGLAVTGCSPVDTALPEQKPGAAEAAVNGSCLQPTVRQVEEIRGSSTLLSVVESAPADAQTQAGYTTPLKIFGGPYMAASVDWTNHGNWANQEDGRHSLEDKVQYPLRGPPGLATDLMTTMSSIEVKAKYCVAASLTKSQ